MTEGSDLRTRAGPSPAEELWDFWRHGRRPDLRAFLAAAGPLGPDDLLAVLRVDQQQRWLAGEPVPTERYLADHPVLGEEPEKALALIYCEYLLAEESGAPPPVEEFVARFPAHAARLREQIGLHKALASSGTATREGSPPATGATLPTAGGRAAPPLLKDPSRPLLPGYEVVRELGRGGMGVVYEARDLRRGRPVALKVMQWADAAALYRFKREFRTLAELQHPNLVTLYELVAEGPTWFFTMELLDGKGFLAHVRDGGPAARWAALREALAQLAEGLRALHAAGKLHRDVKPGNVLVTRAGRVVLLDFGLAADLGSAGEYQSVQPRLLGTVAYMAPEQAACQPVRPASDWYALGVMLYEALTGRLPFDGVPMEILVAKQKNDPAPPAALRPDLPEDLGALCMDLLRRDPAARPSGEEVLRRLRTAPAAPAVRPTAGLEVPLIGRSRHLAVLAEAFAAARGGVPGVLAVHGHSGAGKSALLRCFLDGLTARGEAVVLAGRCYEQESVPYKALDSLIDALSRHLESLPPLEAQALLPRDVAALVRVFPVLRRVEAVASAPRAAGEAHDPQEARRRALAALRELLGRMGDRQPLILAIDDLQWGDLDSAALLTDLLAPPGAPALLLVGCYRSEDAGSSPCLAAFAELRARAGGRELAVEPLGHEERRELVLSLLGPEAEAEADLVARQSGGYPFFVHELVQHLQEGSALAKSGSASDCTLHEVLWARVQRLPADARQLLEVVAVAGRPVALAAACRAAGVEGEERPALGLLRAGRLVRGAGAAERGEVETYHDRVRETVAARLTAGRRQHYHRRLAEVLEEGRAGDPEVLAVHWQGAGEPARAGHYAARAAAQAAQALAFDRAATLYRRALELLPSDAGEGRTLQARLGDALAGAGRGVEAARAYLAAAAGAEAGEALELRRRASLQLLSSGHVDDGMAELRGVLGAVGMRLRPTPRAAFWSLVWQRLLLRLRGLGYRPRPATAIPPAELTALDVCVTAAVGLSMVDPIQGAYFQSRALLLALRAGEPERLVAALALEAGHESIGGSRSRRRTAKLLRAAESLAAQTGAAYPRAMLVLAKGIAAAFEGDWPRAFALCGQGEAALRSSCTGVMWELSTAQRFLLWPLMFMGEVAEIERRLPGLIKEAQERDDLYGVSNLSLVVRTFARLAADEPGRAREGLRELMDQWSRQGFQVQHMNRLYDEAQIDLYQGDGDSAWRRVTERWPLVERSHLLRVQQVRIFLRHLRGRCALAAGRPPGEAEREARALWREGVPWARALAQLLYAGAAGRGAAELWRDAAARCDATAMHLFAAAARRRLGELTTGTAGAELVAAADAWMKGQGVARPGRMAGLLVPGCVR